MIALAIRFPASFLSSTIFILCGETGNEVLDYFCDIQDLERRVMNLRAHAQGYQDPVWNISEEIFCKYTEKKTISTEEALAFLKLNPAVCEVVDEVESDTAVDDILNRQPGALFRKLG